MAGRHRKPPAWRRVLSSLLRSRASVRTAAMRAEILALRATVAALQEELDTLRAAAAAAAAEREAAPAVRPAAAAQAAGSTLDLPLVRLALDDVAVDRGADAALTEIVLTTSPVTATGEAVTLADLPERVLLDPAEDRDAEPVDLATAAKAIDPPQRRTA